MFRHRCSFWSSASCSVSTVTGSSVPYASSRTRTSLKRGHSKIACSTESTTSWPGHLVQFGDRVSFLTFRYSRKKPCPERTCAR
uniref:Putative secreted protein n=1 Tax=Anopheles marajoara TaxID=58244 RepID=A0A2M4CAZ9_9DIPT